MTILFWVVLIADFRGLYSVYRMTRFGKVGFGYASNSFLLYVIGAGMILTITSILAIHLLKRACRNSMHRDRAGGLGMWYAVAYALTLLLAYSVSIPGITLSIKTNTVITFVPFITVSVTLLLWNRPRSVC